VDGLTKSSCSCSSSSLDKLIIVFGPTPGKSPSWCTLDGKKIYMPANPRSALVAFMLNE